jgi:NADH-quinone oxidoreductase subunit C
MTFLEIIAKITEQFGQAFLDKINDDIVQPSITVSPSNLYKLCAFLQQTEGLYFDYLACLSGMDNGEKVGTMEVIYHINSLPFEHSIVVQVIIPRDLKTTVPTISTLWRTADWHEREAFDLFGIQFEGHPDLRRILLANDWEGHPMQKDYKEQEYYHGITVKY